jgi:hypothetical protein
MMIYVVGIPAWMYMFLRKHATQLAAIDNNNVSTGSAADVQFSTRYSFLYRGYRLSSLKDRGAAAYYWEVVVIARKVTLLGVGVLLSESPSLQCILGLFIVAIATIGHRSVKPFETEILNHAEFVSLVSSMCMYLFGLLIFTGEDGEDAYLTASVQTVLSVFALLSNAVFYIYLVKVYVKRPAIVHPDKNTDEALPVEAVMIAEDAEHDTVNLKSESTNCDIDEPPTLRYVSRDASGTLKAKRALKEAFKKQHLYNMIDIQEMENREELVLVYEDDSPDERGDVIRTTIVSSDPTESKVA